MKSPIEAANAWYRKAQNEEDDFDRFVYLWFAFNILYSEYMRENERYAICKFISSNWRSITTIDYILQSSESAFFKDRIIRDCKSGNCKNTQAHSEILKSTRMKRERFEALIMIIYQVRCNLFHGNKLFSSDADQTIVKNAANIMQMVLVDFV